MIDDCLSEIKRAKPMTVLIGFARCVWHANSPGISRLHVQCPPLETVRNAHGWHGLSRITNVVYRD